MSAHRSQQKKSANFYPPWSPRFWNGMITPEFFKLAIANQFNIHLARYPMTALVGACSMFNWAASGIQHLAYGGRIRRTEIERPPVFILGHWRSGTTLLHELLSLDNELAYPSNFDTFTTRHSMVTRWIIYPILSLLMPGQRPMDSMKLTAYSPQEDDMALISLGAPTPYQRIAFPNHQNRLHEQLDPERMSAQEREQFSEALLYFYKILTLRYQRRLLLKSPPHTGRIELLVKMFPGAKFVHISRDPMRMVPSTLHLWRSIDEVQGFQTPNYDEAWLRQYVNECKQYMYEGYFRGRAAIDPADLIEIRLEQLLENPNATIRRIYTQFELPGIESMMPKINDYFAAKQNHQTNRLDVPDDLKDEIRENWGDYMRHFGYINQPSAVTN